MGERRRMMKGTVLTGDVLKLNDILVWWYTHVTKQLLNALILMMLVYTVVMRDRGTSR